MSLSPGLADHPCNNTYGLGPHRHFDATTVPMIKA